MNILFQRDKLSVHRISLSQLTSSARTHMFQNFRVAARFFFARETIDSEFVCIRFCGECECTDDSLPRAHTHIQQIGSTWGQCIHTYANLHMTKYMYYDLLCYDNKSFCRFVHNH